jgi:O-antigen/teichoic acid export membrane protein
MLDRIFKLGKESAIYGLSSIVGRFLNFLLVPFYTNFLFKAELGTVGYLYSYIAFAFVIYGYGMDSAYMRFVASLESGDKKQTISAPFFSLLVTSFLLSLLIYFSAASIGDLLDAGPERADLVGHAGLILFIRYAAWILFFDTLAIVPFAYLRMENRARLFAGLRILNIIITVVLTVIMFVLFQMRVDVVFIANLIASALTAFVLLWIVSPQLTFRIPGKLYKEMLRFGFPYIPASLAGIAIQVIDRPILKALTNNDTVGIYTANYRLGVLMMLVVGMFDYAWRPFFLTHAKDSDAPKLFSKVFTYFVSLLMLVFVTGTMFIDDIVRIRLFGGYFIGPAYWGGLKIVPVILLAYVFTGAYVNFVVGVYLEKKTKYLPYATGAGAAANIIANYLLIPPLGIMGAAIATLLSYIVMAAGIYFPSQRFYHVEYEWGRILRLCLATGAVVGLFLFTHPDPATLSGISTKLAFTALFIILVFVLRVFDSADIKETKDALARMFTRP